MSHFERATRVDMGNRTSAGIPTVVCGPGSITQAHQPDEFVSLEQLARCEAFVRALAATRELG